MQASRGAVLFLEAEGYVVRYGAGWLCLVCGQGYGHRIGRSVW